MWRWIDFWQKYWIWFRQRSGAISGPCSLTLPQALPGVRNESTPGQISMNIWRCSAFSVWGMFHNCSSISTLNSTLSPRSHGCYEAPRHWQFSWSLPCCFPLARCCPEDLHLKHWRTFTLTVSYWGWLWLTRMEGNWIKWSQSFLFYQIYCYKVRWKLFVVVKISNI